MNNQIILFDGVCNLCNGFVLFVIKRDKQAKFKFGSLQSAEAVKILKDFNFENQKLQTVVFIMDDVIYTRSTAVLKIAKELGGVWKFCYVFIIIPKNLRDCIYNKVSRSRYKMFGKRETCMIPTPELKSRFLE